MTDPTPSAETPRPRGRLLAFGVLTLTFVVILGGALDQMRARARRVFVVNGTGHELRVEVSEQAVSVPAGESRLLHLPEGGHTATIAGVGSSAPPRQQAFSLDSDLLSRHLAREVFVLNVDGAAALIREEARPNGEGGSTLLFGPFLRVRGVDYAFVPFPKRLQGSVQVRLGVAPGPASQVLAAAAPKRIGAALAWAEGQLKPAALDEALLATYARRAAAADPARALAFLTPHLDRSPVQIPWHRAYQTVRLQASDREAVERDYQARLRKAPSSSALMYLLGRVSGDEAIALRRYGMAIEADETNAYAWFGKAVRLFRRGELAEAQRHAQRAAQLRPRDAEMARVLMQVRFARGELAPVRARLERWLERRPTDLALQRELLEVLSAADELGQARDAHQRFRASLSERAPSDPKQRALLSELALLYLQGKYAEQLKRAAALNDLRFRARVELEALIELDRLNEAEQRLAAASDPDAELVLALAWHLKGERAKSAARRTAAVAALSKGGAGDRAAAALLKAGAAELEAVRPLALPPARKAVLLLLLAPPPARAQAIDLATRFNYGRRFPRDFLARAIERMRD